MSSRASSGGGSTGQRGASRIEANFAQWEDFLTARLDVQPAGLFLAGSFDLQVGEEVVAHCSFPGDADGVRLNARVLWRRLRAGSDPNVRAGLGLVLRSSSMVAYRRVVETAEGKTGMAGRRQERFNLRIPVLCSFGRRNPVEVEGEITDVSARGAAVRVAFHPAVGDALFLRIEDSLLGTVELSGFATWVRPNAGIGVAMAAIGVELQFPRDEDRRTWERIVGRAKAETRLSTQYSND